MAEKQANFLADLRTMINAIYPVGSYYWSSSSTSPATLFGVGTWERVKDRFVLAAGDTYSAGSTGGEAAHKLTVAEMPAHSHTVNNHTHTYSNATGVQGHTLTVNEMPAHTHVMVRQHWFDSDKVSDSNSGAIYSWKTTYGSTSATYINSKSDLFTTGGSQSHSHGLSKANANTGGSAPGTSSVGSSTEHNNMPPYVTAYCWHRTA
jgi:microcystin-dependent protein